MMKILVPAQKENSEVKPEPFYRIMHLKAEDVGDKIS